MRRALENPVERTAPVALTDTAVFPEQPDLRQQQVELVFTQAPAALVAAFLVAVMLGVSLRGQADHALRAGEGAEDG